MYDYRIGVDESGKGDFFGPLVIAACYVAPEHLAELEDVRESKKITDSRAMQLSAKIRKTCPHSIIAIGPAKYNELWEQMRNLNKILAWGHARAIENVLEILLNREVSAGSPPKENKEIVVISDQFADPQAVQKRLFELGRKVRLVSKVRAEEDIAVAAASVLARAEFLRRLQNLSKEWGIEFPKGAGPQTITVAKNFVALHGIGQLKQVAKIHFKTMKQIASYE
ncbi:MAG TPA: ribonuclease HIII [Fimbriimonadales bacterium]|nr:ribonuclease HIII [Fimbriimonadales bacterium]